MYYKKFCNWKQNIWSPRDLTQTICLSQKTMNLTLKRKNMFVGPNFFVNIICLYLCSELKMMSETYIKYLNAELFGKKPQLVEIYFLYSRDSLRDHDQSWYCCTTKETHNYWKGCKKGQFLNKKFQYIKNAIWFNYRL